ncbi:hypothetical protein [Alteromonas sp. ASW11-130]|uniref:hypothetical protein n=1 Tax=Alteromonas sp. ASW11-130 TaxID=3015775 RepID=UPI0022419FC5|nr:hypothetical protein [Alteromonas sp. ASW11-130]MCW8091904.1 hypothetical protein [Alteromonas sp. ASW11-130]
MIHKWLHTLLIFFLISSISAFAQEKPIAELYGKPIYESALMPDSKTLSQIARMNSASKEMALIQYLHSQFAETLIEGVLEDFANRQRLKTDNKLKTAFIERFKSQIVDEFDDTDTELYDEKINAIAERQVRHWQINKALYEKFGGVVIFKQNNPQFPVGAYETLLKNHQKAGKLKIFEDRYRAVFWEALEPPYSFEIDPANVDFGVPWWLETKVTP